MRYRIQIEPLLDSILVCVTEIRGEHEYVSLSRKLYTMDAETAHHGGLVELLSWLTEQVASSNP